jgi:hypothetical protein
MSYKVKEQFDGLREERLTKYWLHTSVVIG